MFFFKQYCYEHDYVKNEIGYIGDDLNDYQPMQLAGFIGCPKDSCSEIKHIADYISPIEGGHGAVRDIIEHILRESGEWDIIVKNAYGVGI